MYTYNFPCQIIWQTHTHFVIAILKLMHFSFCLLVFVPHLVSSPLFSQVFPPCSPRPWTPLSKPINHSRNRMRLSSHRCPHQPSHQFHCTGITCAANALSAYFRSDAFDGCCPDHDGELPSTAGPTVQSLALNTPLSHVSSHNKKKET